VSPPSPARAGTGRPPPTSLPPSGPSHFAPLSAVFAGRIAADPPIDDGGILYAGDVIVGVGPRAVIESLAGDAVIVLDAPDAVVTPGLVDAHTHLAYAGSRHLEYEQKLAGADYEAIAKAGGGIASTRQAVADIDPTDLVNLLVRRLRRFARAGVTTVEIKSGYGLDEHTELKQLTAIAQAATFRGVPTIVPTFLALHALPLEFRADRAGYVRGVVERTLPEVVARGLARFVDCYVDRAAFTVAEAEAVLAAAEKLGLGSRLHVGQFADIGGAALAARFGAHSVDHMEHATDESLDALAESGTRVVLLPVASFSLHQAPPPVARMRERGLSLVVASDANPGTATTESLPLAMAMAARTYGLTVDEVLAGATHEAAQSLGLGDRGQLQPGARADFVVWDLPHEACLVQPFGAPPTRLVVAGGRVLYADDIGPQPIRDYAGPIVK
jgi:imidazolonepropionase